MLEARVAELENELEAWRANAAEEIDAEAIEIRIRSLRLKLKGAWPLAGGLQPALMLLAMMRRPGLPISRAQLFSITRTPNSILLEENNRCLIAVRLCHLRRALDNLGFPGVIENLSSAGWCISAANCVLIKAALGV